MQVFQLKSLSDLMLSVIMPKTLCSQIKEELRDLMQKNVVVKERKIFFLNEEEKK